MARRFFRVGLAALAAIGWIDAAAPARAATPEAVDAAVKKAIAALYSQEKSGDWEPSPAPRNTMHDFIDGAQWGGQTGIVVYALLSAGEKPDNTNIASAVKFLRTADLKGVYAVAARAQVWPLLPKSGDNREAAKRDLRLLLGAVKQTGDGKGLWNYRVDPKDEERPDNSASQFATLGVWACGEAGAEVPDAFWRVEDQIWRSNQLPEGGWPYVSKDTGDWGKPTLSMTTAGLATLFLMQDQVKRNIVSCTGNTADAAMSKGFTFLEDRFPTDGNFRNNPEGRLYVPGAGNRSTYLLFAMQRLGLYSGYKYFGKIDWFQAGADYLVKEQDDQGRWGGDAWETALGLLFLARARAPVGFNKLNYSVAGQAPAAPWDQRPRDVANLCNWMTRESESRVNFQVVDIATDPLDWLDAPILMLTGSEELKFTPDQIEKLRKYVNAGGMVVGSADCGAAKFATSFKKLGNAMFPDDEFRELPADHVIYTNEPYPRKRWHAKITAQGITNGDRELMIIVPDADLGKAWQMQNASSKPEQFEIASDFYNYQINDGGSHFRGDIVVTKPDPAIHATRQVCVARLQYPGTWDPEPGGWIRFAAETRNRAKTDINVTTVKLGDGKLDPHAFAVAHLTGTGAFNLKDAWRDEIKKFVDGGGVLIVDSAGGNTSFSTSAEAELGTMFPDTPLADLADGASLLKTPIDATKVAYRKFAHDVVGSSTSPRLKTITRNGRIAVIYSPMDLSVGLLGTGVDGITGYTPASAVAVMTDLVCSAGKK